MSTVRVNRNRCDGCGICVEVCPFEGVVMEANYPRFTASCRVCSICVKECPRDALSVDLPQEGTRDLSRYRGVMVVAEMDGHVLSPVTVELLGAGRRLADDLGEDLSVVLVGDAVANSARDALHYNVERAIVVEHSELAPFRPEAHTDALEEVVLRYMPSIVLMAGTPVGRSLAPRLAVRLRTGLTADCTSLDVNEAGELLQTRPAFGGDIMATILTSRHRPQMATVRPKVMAPVQRGEPRGEVERVQFHPPRSYSSKVLRVNPTPAAATVADAEVVVAAGRGVRRAEDLNMVERLADSLGGIVGCSRPLVEAGWLPATRQVGLSGRTVRPKLYIACGISGAIQHIAGMRSSERIIAINRDANAPIFDVAHYALVGDVYEIIPELIELIEKRGGVRAV
ncbi:MAG: electron transfer flavoprotein subunit alpha [Clostridia bacterium]